MEARNTDARIQYVRFEDRNRQTRRCHTDARGSRSPSRRSAIDSKAADRQNTQQQNNPKVLIDSKIANCCADDLPTNLSFIDGEPSDNPHSEQDWPDYIGVDLCRKILKELSAKRRTECEPERYRSKGLSTDSLVGHGEDEHNGRYLREPTGVDCILENSYGRAGVDQDADGLFKASKFIDPLWSNRFRTPTNARSEPGYNLGPCSHPSISFEPTSSKACGHRSTQSSLSRSSSHHSSNDCCVSPQQLQASNLLEPSTYLESSSCRPRYTCQQERTTGREGTKVFATSSFCKTKSPNSRSNPYDFNFKMAPRRSSTFKTEVSSARRPTLIERYQQGYQQGLASRTQKHAIAEMTSSNNRNTICPRCSLVLHDGTSSSNATPEKDPLHFFFREKNSSRAKLDEGLIPLRSPGSHVPSSQGDHPRILSKFNSLRPTSRRNSRQPLEQMRGDLSDLPHTISCCNSYLPQDDPTSNVMKCHKPRHSQKYSSTGYSFSDEWRKPMHYSSGDDCFHEDPYRPEQSCGYDDTPLWQRRPCTCPDFGMRDGSFRATEIPTAQRCSPSLPASRHSSSRSFQPVATPTNHSPSNRAGPSLETRDSPPLSQHPSAARTLLAGHYGKFLPNHSHGHKEFPPSVEGYTEGSKELDPYNEPYRPKTPAESHPVLDQNTTENTCRIRNPRCSPSSDIVKTSPALGDQHDDARGIRDHSADEETEPFFGKFRWQKNSFNGTGDRTSQLHNSQEKTRVMNREPHNITNLDLVDENLRESSLSNLSKMCKSSRPSREATFSVHGDPQGKNDPWILENRSGAGRAFSSHYDDPARRRQTPRQYDNVVDCPDNFVHLSYCVDDPNHSCPCCRGEKIPVSEGSFNSSERSKHHQKEGEHYYAVPLQGGTTSRRNQIRPVPQCVDIEEPTAAPPICERTSILYPPHCPAS